MPKVRSKRAKAARATPYEPPDTQSSVILLPDSQPATQGSTVAFDRDCAIDEAQSSVLSTLDSDELTIPSSHQSSDRASREAQVGDLTIQSNVDEDYRWVRWADLPGYTSLPRGQQKAWWWQLGAGVQLATSTGLRRLIDVIRGTSSVMEHLKYRHAVSYALTWETY
ncbi:hypothetical protein EJ04DRAFT_527293 [Polyplosphaeria fusca]|uniref:Uncharacterized protein n=1 Tax=Polyplosphaeria fusca TaxID=682080 RepID=A0A9P4QSI0_9PLEO|nr:hypothetical protein EJ04DRAFT_527293 [Polyplosphaeria fusca]